MIIALSRGIKLILTIFFTIVFFYLIQLLFSQKAHAQFLEVHYDVGLGCLTGYHTHCTFNTDTLYYGEAFEVPYVAGYRAVGIKVRMHDNGGDWDANPRVNWYDSTYLKTGSGVVSDTCNREPNDLRCEGNNPCFDICTPPEYRTHTYIIPDYDLTQKRITDFELAVYSEDTEDRTMALEGITWLLVPDVPIPPPPNAPPNLWLDGYYDICPGEIMQNVISHVDDPEGDPLSYVTFLIWNSSHTSVRARVTFQILSGSVWRTTGTPSNYEDIFNWTFLGFSGTDYRIEYDLDLSFLADGTYIFELEAQSGSGITINTATKQVGTFTIGGGSCSAGPTPQIESLDAEDFCSVPDYTLLTATYSHGGGHAELRDLGISMQGYQSLFTYDGSSQTLSPTTIYPFSVNDVRVINPTTIEVDYEFGQGGSFPSVSGNDYDISLYADDHDDSQPSTGWQFMKTIHRYPESESSTFIDMTLDFIDPEGDGTSDTLSYSFNKTVRGNDPPVIEDELTCSGPGYSCINFTPISSPTASHSRNVSLLGTATPGASAVYTVRTYCAEKTISTVINAPANPWLMTLAGDAHSSEGLKDIDIPVGIDVDAPNIITTVHKINLNNHGYFSTFLFAKNSGNFTVASEVTSKTGRTINNYSDANVSRYFSSGNWTNWLANGGFKDLLESNGKTITQRSTSTAVTNAIKATGDSVTEYTGSAVLNIPANTVCKGRNIIFTQKTLALNPPFTADKGSGCVFIVGGDVQVNAGSSSGTTPDGVTYDRIDAVVISLSSWLTNSSSNQLYWDGSVLYRNTGTLRRTVGNQDSPSELVKYNPKYLELFRDYLGTGYNYKVREVNYTGR